jgi:hypothetical protein
MSSSCHQGKDYNFPARLLSYGYTIKLEIEIEGNTVLFEPDEERNWKAMLVSKDTSNPRIFDF